jgi:mycothiol system anti-sigma-R factor
VDDREATEDCSAALEELYWFLDGELTVARRAAIRGHLDRCMGCLETFEFEAELRALISACCRADTVPEHLRVRVVEAIAALEEDAGEG